MHACMLCLVFGQDAVKRNNNAVSRNRICLFQWTFETGSSSVLLVATLQSRLGL